MLKEDILQAIKLKSEIINIGKNKVSVIELGAAEYLSLLDNPVIKNKDGEINNTAFNGMLIVRCLRDKNGNRIFDDSEYGVLQDGSFSGLRSILEAVNRVNGFSGEAKN